ncbi:MAG: Ig-like domain-containing protein [Verrucomicrobiota bacterium]
MNVIRNLFKVALLSAAVAVFGGSLSGSAATANVLVGSGGLVFTPATTNIAVNDRVIWTWAGNNHSTTSDTNGLWDSLVNNSPHSFTNTFTSAGTFPYHCTIHVNLGMKGMIIVASPNVPPTVSITNPASGTVFAAPANVTIQVSASDTDGTVTNVQFLIGSTILTNETVAPFSAVTNNLAAGNYTLSAIASDNSGAKATNAITIGVVAPVPVTLSVPLQPAANFQFSYSANAGLSYVVQRSTNLLANWIPLATNLAGSSSVTFTDINVTVNPAFYRVGLLPNP